MSKRFCVTVVIQSRPLHTESPSTSKRHWEQEAFRVAVYLSEYAMQCASYWLILTNLKQTSFLKIMYPPVQKHSLSLGSRMPSCSNISCLYDWIDAKILCYSTRKLCYHNFITNILHQKNLTLLFNNIPEKLMFMFGRSALSPSCQFLISSLWERTNIPEFKITSHKN